MKFRFFIILSVILTLNGGNSRSNKIRPMSNDEFVLAYKHSLNLDEKNIYNLAEKIEELFQKNDFYKNSVFICNVISKEVSNSYLKLYSDLIIELPEFHQLFTDYFTKYFPKRLFADEIIIRNCQTDAYKAHDNIYYLISFIDNTYTKYLKKLR